MAWKIGEAFVKLFANKDQLKADMADAEQIVKDGAAKVELGWKSALKINLLDPEKLAMAGRKILDLGMQAIAAGDRLRELSQITNVSVEQLSRLDYAGQTAGVGLEEVGTSLRFLSRNQDAALQGSKSLREMFGKIGLDAAKLKQMRPDEIFLTLAEAMKQGKLRGQEVSVAMALLGRSGSQMVPMLMEGRDGLQALMDTADAAGYTISTDFAADADRFGDALTMAKNDVVGFTRTVLRDAMPALKGLGDYVSDTLPGKMSATKVAAKGLSTVIQFLATTWTTAFHFMRQLTIATMDAFVVYGQTTKKVLAGDITGAIETYNKGMEEGTKRHLARNEEYRASLAKIWNMQGAFDADRKSQAEWTDEAGEHENKNLEEIERKQKMINLQLRAQRAELSGNKTEAEKLRKEYDAMEAAALMTEGLSKATADETVQLKAQTRELEANNEAEKKRAAARKKASEEAARDWEKNRAQIMDARKLVWKLTEEENKAAQEELARRNDNIVEMVRMRAEASAELQRITSSEFENAYAAITKHSEMEQERVQQSVMSEQWKADQIKIIRDIENEHLRELNAEYGRDFDRMLENQINAFGTQGQRMVGMWRDTTNDMQTLFGDVFYSAFVGDMEGIEDAFDNFLSNMLKRIMNFLAEQAVIQLLKMLQKQGAGTWWGALAGTAATAMGAGGTGGGGTGETLHLADGGVVEGGFRALAGGGTVTGPTVALMGEAGMNEAVVPLPNGKAIPVDMGNASQDVVINQRIIIGADLLAAGRPSDDEIVAAVNGNVARHGGMYQTIRRRR